MTVALVQYYQSYLGVAADVKPTTEVRAGARFYETDTAIAYVYDGAAWVVLQEPSL